MTGKLDTRMRALGQRLIDSYGKPVTLRRTTSTYDPSTGTTSTSTTDYSVNGILEAYSENRIDGSLVKSGDLRLTIPAKDLSVTPDQTQDSILVDSESWSIVVTRRVYSGEQPALYELQIRK